MKPFDLEAAKRGEPIQTRDGREAKFIAHVTEAEAISRVVFLCGRSIYSSCEDGTYYGRAQETAMDPFMAPKKNKRGVWVNLYEGGSTGESWWDSEETANNYAFPPLARKRIGGKAHHVVIEWEE